MDSSRVVYGTSNSGMPQTEGLGFLFDYEHFRLVWCIGLELVNGSQLFHQKRLCINDVSCY